MTKIQRVEPLASPPTPLRYRTDSFPLADVPEVITRIVRQDGAPKAHLEIEVAGRNARLYPEPIKPEIVGRDLLVRRVARSVDPAIPARDRAMSVLPRFRKRRPWLLRFGDIRYRPTTIFNPDGRRAYYDTRYPWRCLVRIMTPVGWSGSGVLIGPRHVLTASHCVDWTPGWLSVEVLYANGSSLATSGAFTAYAASKVAKGEISDSQNDEDYAVVVLNDRLGDQYGWMGCRTYDSAWDDEVSVWCNIGYPQDISNTGDTPCFQKDFLLNEVALDYGSARLIESDTFDNWPGQSGSPIFGFWPQGPYVVGVVSGEGDDYNYISGGSLLTSLVARARSDHP